VVKFFAKLAPCVVGLKAHGDVRRFRSGRQFAASIGLGATRKGAT
jgi:transposase